MHVRSFITGAPLWLSFASFIIIAHSLNIRLGYSFLQIICILLSVLVFLSLLTLFMSWSSFQILNYRFTSIEVVWKRGVVGTANFPSFISFFSAVLHRFFIPNKALDLVCGHWNTNEGMSEFVWFISVRNVLCLLGLHFYF